MAVPIQQQTIPMAIKNIIAEVDMQKLPLVSFSLFRRSIPQASCKWLVGASDSGVPEMRL